MSDMPDSVVGLCDCGWKYHRAQAEKMVQTRARADIDDDVDDVAEEQGGLHERVCREDGEVTIDV
jgi:hypothetical protein